MPYPAEEVGGIYAALIFYPAQQVAFMAWMRRSHSLIARGD
jgi:hypothetical protein